MGLDGSETLLHGQDFTSMRACRDPIFGDSFTFDIHKQLLKGSSLVELDVEVFLYKESVPIAHTARTCRDHGIGTPTLSVRLPLAINAINKVWDEKNAFRREKRTGVHLTIDLCTIMEAWVPMRDSWWLLDNVDDGEIHIQVG